MFWPDINTDIKKMVSQCSHSLDQRARQCPEPVIPHEVLTQPWSKVGSDLFQLDNKEYVLIVDYHSN